MFPEATMKPGSGEISFFTLFLQHEKNVAFLLSKETKIKS